MTINSQRFNVSELDFDAIKLSLKTYLQGQSQFSDFDFDGSNMSVLLDILSYNTHYRALYDNFILNEMFLDSASKRDNVVSRAKELGYTPTSATCATAIVNMNISNTTNGPSILVLPKLTTFTAALNGSTYPFVTMQSYSATAVGTTYSIPNITLYQGQFVADRYPVSPGSTFTIANQNVDTATLTVKVQDNPASSIYRTYNLVTGIVGITAVDRVFWLKEVRSGLYELEFGNGVVGAALETGNVVCVEYLITAGSTANTSKLFSYSDNSIYNGTVSLNTVAQSYNGGEIESIDSVKFNAPRLYSTQNRAVTVEDYINLVYNLVPDAASVNVWSGSDNIPPVYGKVFICIKPTSVEAFTNIQKVTIQNDIIGSKNLITVIPVVVDPTYIKVAVTTSIYYDQKTTTKSANDIKLLTTNTISNYNNVSLGTFGSVLRFSKLTRAIDDSDASIISNITTLMIHCAIAPKYNTLGTYDINIVNPIYTSSGSVGAIGTAESSIISTGFYILGSDLIHYIEDDGLGNLYLYNKPNLTKQIVNPKIGSVIYGKGIITISGLYVTAIVGSNWSFMITPISYDVVSVLDQLVIIPPELITVNVIADQSVGSSAGGANYTFTTSRS